MNKEVKIRLPKGKKVKLIDTSIKDNNIVVKYKLEEQYIPKNGDIVFIKVRGIEWISIFKRNEDTRLLSYCDLTNDNKNLYYCGNENSCCYNNEIKELRLATEEEKSKLFSALKEKGLVWNEETKSIEKYRWRAHGDETYWYVDRCGIVQEKSDCHFQSDDGLFNLGNYFDTEEKAKEYADKIKDLYKSNV